MKSKNISLSDKIKFIGLLITALVFLCLSIYALVYASSDSIYKKYSLIIGIGFITVSRFTITGVRAYCKFNSKSILNVILRGFFVLSKNHPPSDIFE